MSIDPRSYQRYDKIADAVSGLDARSTARLYTTLKPRIQDGYKELGHPDGNFDPVLQQALVELLKTPVLEGDVALGSKASPTITPTRGCKGCLPPSGSS